MKDKLQFILASIKIVDQAMQEELFCNIIVFWILMKKNKIFERKNKLRN